MMSASVNQFQDWFNRVIVGYSETQTYCASDSLIPPEVMEQNT